MQHRKTHNHIYYLSLFVVLLTFNSCKIQSNVSSEDKQSIFDSTVVDIDGNIYHAIQIGNQLWMRSNLRTSRYNNGASIRKSPASNNLSTPKEVGMIIINSINNHYGNLYNYYAVIEEGLCPSGWHVPSADEWSTMIQKLGGECNLGELSNTNNGIDLYNEMGGMVNPENIIDPISGYEETGYWWTSSNIGRNTAAFYQLSKSDSCIQKSGAKESNFLSVRCVKKNISERKSN